MIPTMMSRTPNSNRGSVGFHAKHRAWTNLGFDP